MSAAIQRIKRTAGAVATTVATASGLGVGHVDADATAVELLLVHGVDGGVSLSLGGVGLEYCQSQIETFNSMIRTTKPKPRERPVSRSFMTM